MVPSSFQLLSYISGLWPMKADLKRHQTRLPVLYIWHNMIVQMINPQMYITLISFGQQRPNLLHVLIYNRFKRINKKRLNLPLMLPNTIKYLMSY
jgi:hypothetical protein